LIILRVFTGNGSETGSLTLTDQATENVQNKMGTNPPLKQEVQARENTPQISAGEESSRTYQERPRFNAGNKPVLANESPPDVDSFSSREKFQLAMIGSKSIERVERSITSPVQTGETYQAFQKNSPLTVNDKVVEQSGDNPRLSLWILADAGVRGLNSVSEEAYHLDREKDKNGRIRRFTLDTPVFGISAPVRNPDKQQ
jgi:hypothetical protein